MQLPVLLPAQLEYTIGWQAPRGSDIVYEQFAETFEVVSSQLNSTFIITLMLLTRTCKQLPTTDRLILSMVDLR